VYFNERSKLSGGNTGATRRTETAEAAGPSNGAVSALLSRFVSGCLGPSEVWPQLRISRLDHDQATLEKHLPGGTEGRAVSLAEGTRHTPRPHGAHAVSRDRNDFPRSHAVFGPFRSPLTDSDCARGRTRGVMSANPATRPSRAHPEEPKLSRGQPRGSSRHHHRLVAVRAAFVRWMTRRGEVEDRRDHGGGVFPLDLGRAHTPRRPRPRFVQY
jgi:hypothetical protein